MINAGVIIKPYNGKQQYNSINQVWEGILIEVNYPIGQNSNNNPPLVGDYIVEDDGELWIIENVSIVSSNPNQFEVIVKGHYDQSGNSSLNFGNVVRGSILSPINGTLVPYWDASKVSTSISRILNLFNAENKNHITQDASLIKTGIVNLDLIPNLPISRINSLQNTLDTKATLNITNQLSDAIDNINVVLGSNDTNLDQLQEIVNYIKQNKTNLDTLGITNIAGLVDALNSKISKDGKTDIDALNVDAGTVNGNTVLTSVPTGALFTDTIYTKPASEPISYISGLNTALSNKVAINSNQALFDGTVLSVNNDTITLKKGDGTTESVTVSDSDTWRPITDTLTSSDPELSLSANQGKILKSYIDNINALVNSNDTNLDQLQEIVDFIKQNKSNLDSLGITNIAGLDTALNAKQDTLNSGSNIKTINGSSILGTGNIVLDSNTKRFDIEVSSFAGMGYTAPTGITVKKVYSNSSLQITHNQNKKPASWAVYNTVSSPITQIVPSNTKNMQIVDNNNIIITSLASYETMSIVLIF